VPEKNPPSQGEPGSRLAVFEYIGFLNLVLVFLYILRGFRVRFLEMDTRLADLGPLKRYLTEEKMEKIRWADLDLDRQYSLNNEILQGNDAAFAKEFGTSRLIILLRDLVGSDLVTEAYRKYLTLDRYDLALREYQLKETGVRLGGGKVFEVVLRNPLLRKAFFTVPGTADSRFHIPLWNRLTLSLRVLGAKVGYAGILVLFPLYLLVKTGVPSLRLLSPSPFRVGIRVYRTDFGCRRRYRSIDFLVDGRVLDTRNTLICAETVLDPPYWDCLKEKGYRTADISRALRGIHVGFVSKVLLKKGVPFWLRCIPRAMVESPLTIKRTLEFFYTYLLWEAFCEKYALSHYVTYNDALPKDIIRNLVLSQHHVGTWYYEHSSNTANLFVPVGREEYKTVHYSHLVFDHLVVWGDKIRRYYAMHPQKIGAYEHLGCPWSEHVDWIHRNPGENRCLGKAKEHYRRTLREVPERIIGIFDTSASDSSIFSPRDLESFLDGILRLIKEKPDIGFIFKMKYAWSFMEGVHPELLQCYENIRACPNCCLFYDEGPEAMITEVAEAIAASDLVISACFTSPTIEGLGARQKGIFYDATGAFRGCYYDGFPNLVAHDYDELKRLIGFWLDSVTPAEFDPFLEKYVRGELDANVDGKGITRFRDLLIG
jgi:polysaccharide biosynthesis PFTS motif protein